MGGLSAFLKENKIKTLNVKYAASQAFLDEDGKPLEWEIRAMKTREAEAIRSQCNEVFKGGKIKTDNAKFNRMMAAACTVYPNLNDAELQDSYGVMGAENLITEMLDMDGEFQKYVQKCLEVSGYNKTDAELVDEAKN
jgi:hypothetical protein